MSQTIACRTCGQVHAAEDVPPGMVERCCRCNSVIERRTRQSLHRTAAFSLAALILYLPANVFPILHMEIYGAASDTTVWQGAKLLYDEGQWPIALIVFLASILIPLLKLLGLIFLVATASIRWRGLRQVRTRLYQFIEVIGRWAMLDVFVLAVLVSLVKLHQMATIIAGPGALAFAGVVVCTLLASASFDPQLIWEKGAMSRMSQIENHTLEQRQLPLPKVTKMRWPFPLIWLVPLLAAAAAGYYLHLHDVDNATVITVAFKDASGLKPGQTPVSIRGVEIGKVSQTELDETQQKVLVHVALQKQYASIAKEGALFWIVEPDFSNGMITGLGTIVSGPYIEAVPGVGAPESQFVGLEKQPVSLGEGLILILHADHLEHLQPNSPILYRGVQVGVVRDAHLAPDATHVNVNAIIWYRFGPLVTDHSEFWSVSGADVKGGIFSGISVKLDSLQNLLSGAVEFATPIDAANQPAQDGAAFELHAEPKKDWLAWAPRIKLPPEAVSNPDSKPDQRGTNSVGAELKGKP